GRGAELANPLIDAMVRIEPAYAGPDRRWVNVQTGTAGVNHLELSIHRTTLPRPTTRGDLGRWDRLLYVLPNQWGRQVWVRHRGRGQACLRAHGHQTQSTAKNGARTE